MTQSTMRRALLLAAAASSRLAAGEIITLTEGQRIEAPVVYERPTAIYVDLGFEVVRIPRASVRSVEKPQEAGAAAQAAVSDTDDLYSTAHLPVATVKQLTERFGEGVVLVSSPSSNGSGFFIHRDGYLLTNCHVIEGETRIAITIFRDVGGEFRREKIEDVDIVATNPFLDLALLKARLPENYKPVLTYLAADDKLRDGDAVFAIGNPLGLERSVSEGIISRRNRAESGLAFIQTTAQINPGNSGGPLFDARGQVIGVTNMKITSGEGLGFAIPIRYAIDFLRNREAFAYNSESSVAGFRYLQPPGRQDPAAPDLKAPPRTDP
ncbi:MAG: hypothetical protein CHACPFDD_00438 [Phycisphaerae bacterium]|nr:hypothetical protein [Phycisphaerae bacterium]